MDAALPPELIEIYHTEIIERSRRLASGARQLALGRLSPESIGDLVRDAHTVKGSSRVVGLAEMGNAGALLEQAWKNIETGSTTANATVGRALEQLANMLPEAAEQEQQGMTARLRDLVVRTEKALTGGSTNEDDLPLKLAEAQDQSFGPTSLGGLLAAVERSMLAGTSRVDTIDLYQLINQAVEVSLDADALSDLALVQFEGADPQRLMS
ncbi:MAG TPA: Hpt domain-containing protein, partial [Acidimicrobiia bacterium]|nr:Hpt domain-containing protein [Acidimicrobiia bacterium]